jgi:hypothetical protein
MASARFVQKLTFSSFEQQAEKTRHAAHGPPVARARHCIPHRFPVQLLLPRKSPVLSSNLVVSDINKEA